MTCYEAAEDCDSAAMEAYLTAMVDSEEETTDNKRLAEVYRNGEGWNYPLQLTENIENEPKFCIPDISPPWNGAKDNIATGTNVSFSPQNAEAINSSPQIDPLDDNPKCCPPALYDIINMQTRTKIKRSKWRALPGNVSRQ